MFTALNNLNGRVKAPIYNSIDLNVSDFELRDYYAYIPPDYVKLKLNNINIKHLENTLDFTQIVNTKTGELNNYKTAYLKNLEIKLFYNGYCELKGSLHIYSNDGLHNYNQFTQKAFLNALYELKNTLNIELSDMYILGMEWGFNIVPPLIATHTILNHCIYHVNTIKMPGPVSKSEGNYNQFIHSDFILKIYDKGKQHNVGNIMRIEIKQNNWSKYRAKGIITMEDFVNFNKSPFIKELITQWEKVVFFSPLIQENEKWDKYKTPIFWQETRGKSTTTYKKHFDKLQEINRTEGGNLQKEISKILVYYMNELNGGGYKF